jgi:hypothetical protein
MIEIDTFRLAAGADPSDEAVQAFLAADAAAQERFAYQQPGFVRRTTAFSGDGRWAVITQWESRDAADLAKGAAFDSEVMVAFDTHIDPATRKLDRFQPIG